MTDLNERTERKNDYTVKCSVMRFATVNLAKLRFRKS